MQLSCKHHKYATPVVNITMAKITSENSTKKHRGKNFSSSDDVNISIAWLAISNDPLKVQDQSGETFWKDVQDHAQLKNRNWDTIRQRWGQISRAVIKFVECYNSVIRNRTPGTLKDDVYDEAVKLFLANTESKYWKFAECWELLRNDPKFIHVYEVKSAKGRGGGGSSTFPSHSSSHTEHTDIDTYDVVSNVGGTGFGDLNSASEISIAYDAENGFQQPSNWKESNKYVYQHDLETRRVEALELLAKAAERKNELIAEHTKALQEATDAKIITTSGKNLDSLSLQILELKKIKILMELKNQSN